MSSYKDHPQIKALKNAIKEMRGWLEIVERRELWRASIVRETRQLTALKQLLSNCKDKEQKCELQCSIKLAERKLAQTKEMLKILIRDSKGLPYA